MTITALQLLKEAAKRGWTFQVDGGGTDEEGCTEYDYVGNKPLAAWNAVKDTTEATVHFLNNGHMVGYALLMAPGPMTCADDETLADYAYGPLNSTDEFRALCDNLIEKGV